MYQRSGRSVIAGITMIIKPTDLIMSRFSLLLFLFLSATSAWAQQRPAPPPTGTATSLEEAAEKWSAYVEEQFAPSGFSGGIHLSRGHEVILEQFWGKPADDSDRAFERDTRFNVGSMGKMFTALAIGQLVESGRLDWQDTIGSHYPEFPWPAHADQITIEQLLSHQSGLGNYPFNHGQTDVEQIVAAASSEPLAFEPGERMGYSNTGYAVLGVVIERVTGMNYYDYIREHIFARAGMSRSGFFAALEPVDNMANGYTERAPDGSPIPGGRQPNAALIEPIGSPAGGSYSTLADLQQFGLALMDDRLVTRAIRDELWRGRALMGGTTWYALGFGVSTKDDKRVVGHNGGGPGIGAVLQLFPDTGVLAVAFTNQDPMPINPLTREIVGLIRSIPKQK